MKKKHIKRILLAFLALVMVLTTMPVIVLGNRADSLFFEEVMNENPLERLRNRVRSEFRGHGRLDLSLEQMEVLMAIDPFFYLIPDTQIYSTTTLMDDFEDDAVVIVLNRSISRDNRDFTLEDFPGIGAIYVRDLSRLSTHEYSYAVTLWNIERDLVLAEKFTAFSLDSEAALQELQMNYIEIREKAEENTLVNFDDHRRILLLRLDQNNKANVLDVVQQLQVREDVYWVGPNYIITLEEYGVNALTTNNMIAFNSLWARSVISLPQAHNITRGSRNVRVGILGSSIQQNHSELIGRVRFNLGGTFYNMTDNPNPFTWGTQQAGIIGGTNVGIAPNVEFVPLIAVNADGRMPNDAAVAGINHARMTGIPIINRSFYVTTPSNAPFFNAVKEYRGLFVNAAGNDIQDIDSTPWLPGLDHVLIVGASNQNDTRRASSNWGRTSVHLFAPGDTQTAFPNNTFGVYTGTSAATPHVAGVAALMLSINPSLSGSELQTIISESVDPVTAFRDISISGGRLNAYTAVRGATANRWTTINTNWYYFNNRSRRTGWFSYSNNYYFLNPRLGTSANEPSIPLGQMRTGWVRNGGWFFLNPRSGEPGRTSAIPQGAMRTGWLQYRGDWYFLNTRQGATNHNRNLHEGQMFTGTHTIDGERFTFNSSGICTIGRGC